MGEFLNWTEIFGLSAPEEMLWAIIALCAWGIILVVLGMFRRKP